MIRSPLARRSLCVLGLLLCLAASIEAQVQVPAGSEGRNLHVSLAEAVDLAVRNNLDLRLALIEEVSQRSSIREALGTFDPRFFADLSGGTSESLFSQSFPIDPADPMSPTVDRIISQRRDQARLDTGLRGTLVTGMTYDITFRVDHAYLQTGGALNPVFTHSTSLSFTQPLLRAGWQSYQEAAVDRARVSSLRAHQDYRVSVRGKVAEVQQAYYDLIFALEDEKVNRNSVGVAERQVADTRVRVNAGALPEIEITSAESGLAQRRADLVTAEFEVVRAEDQLRRLILAFNDRRDWAARIRPTEAPEERILEVKSVDEILRLAERSEPTLLQARLDVARAEIVLRERESEAQPQLDLRGSGAWNGLGDNFADSTTTAFGDDGAFSWSLGLALEVPLGNRAAGARLTQSQLELRKSRVALQNSRIEVAFQVRNALRKIQVARRSIRARKEALRLAEEQLADERLKLQSGSTTNFQVFQVEDQRNRSRTDFVRVLLDYRLALLELSRVSAVPIPELLKTP